MAQGEPGILRTSFRFALRALNENALLRTSVLWTVLLVTLVCIALSAFGVTFTLDPKDGPQSYSPRVFGLLFLPAEFFVFDLILGNPAPRTTLASLYLDWRLPRYFWVMIKVVGVVLLPAAAVMFALLGLTVGLGKGGRPDLAAVAVLGVGLLVLVAATLYFLFRYFYVIMPVARRDATPVRTAFRETKGKIWRINCALFLPYLVIIAVTVPMELLGSYLERTLGFVGLAPWFLLDAAMTGFVCCLSAAVMAVSYQRVVVSGATPAPEPTAVQAPGPQGS